MIFSSWKTTMKHHEIKRKANSANTTLNSIGYVWDCKWNGDWIWGRGLGLGLRLYVDIKVVPYV